MAQPRTGKVVRMKTGAGAPPVRPPTIARDAIAAAFDAIGGVAALAEWVKASEDNRKIFYTNLYPKIISSQLGGEPENPTIHEIRRTIVRP